MLVIKCQGKFIIFQFASAMHQQKNCLGLRRNFCIFVGNGFGIPQHFAKGYDLFFQQLTLILPVLYCLLIIHLKGRNKRQYFSCWSPCFGFFVCPCYNRRTHYPTLEKSGAQNTKACENQGKQSELSNHWKLKREKTLFFTKIIGDDAKKTKRF